MKRPPWMLYSKKLKERVIYPRYVGVVTSEEATTKKMRLAVGQEGSLEEGAAVKLYLLVNEMDGVIIEVRFQAFGDPALIGIADTVCDVLLKKTYAQGSRISADLIDKKLRDHPGVPAFPDEVYRYLNWVISAVFEATGSCQDIILADPYAHTPLDEERVGVEGHNHYKDWDTYSQEEKLTIIQEIVKEEIEPYIALDEGGVEVKELKENREVVVIYQGSCTSCFSATGATLNAIQQILRDKVHPDLFVTPDMSVLKF